MLGLGPWELLIILMIVIAVFGHRQCARQQHS